MYSPCATPSSGFMMSPVMKRKLHRMARVKALTLGIAASFAILGPAYSQGTFPEKPVRIIVDSAPGSGVDVVMRLMADRLATIWNQQAVIDNRPGAGGSIAVRAGQAA